MPPHTTEPAILHGDTWTNRWPSATCHEHKDDNAAARGLTHSPDSKGANPTQEERQRRAEQPRQEGKERGRQAPSTPQDDIPPEHTEHSHKIAPEDFNAMPWLINLTRVCAWVRDSSVLVEGSDDPSPITYIAIWLGPLEYSPTTLHSLFDVEEDPCYKHGERMITNFGHHVSLLYGPSLPPPQRQKLEKNLNDVLHKWINLRRSPATAYLRIQTLLRIPTHAYIKRLRGTSEEYMEQVRLHHWSHTEVIQALEERTIVSKVETVESDSYNEDAELVLKIWHRDRRRLEEAIQTLTYLNKLPDKCLQSDWSLLTFPDAKPFAVTRDRAPELYDMIYFLKDFLIYPAGLHCLTDASGEKLWNNKLHHFVPDSRLHVSPSNEVHFEIGQTVTSSASWSTFNEQQLLAEYDTLHAPKTPTSPQSTP